MADDDLRLKAIIAMLTEFPRLQDKVEMWLKDHKKPQSNTKT